LVLAGYLDTMRIPAAQLVDATLRRTEAGGG